MISARQTLILKTIVEDFIKTARPISSKSLIDEYGLNYSSATLRNEMARLEDLGYLEKTHTSSGRIPSQLGYRYYVDNLLAKDDLDLQVKAQLSSIFANRQLEIEQVVQESCRIISQITSYTSIGLGNEEIETLRSMQLVEISESSMVVIMVMESGKVENRVFNIPKGCRLSDIQNCVSLMNEHLVGCNIDDIAPLLESKIKPLIKQSVSHYEMVFDLFVTAFVQKKGDKVYVAGQNNLLYQPEFNDINKLRSLMLMIEDATIWKQISKHNKEIEIIIGNENNVLNSEDVSIVSAPYHGENQTGSIIVVGPKRMEYQKVLNLVEFVAENINYMLNKR